jgi:hypothetical protein
MNVVDQDTAHHALRDWRIADVDFQGWGSVWGVASTTPHLELVEIVKCPESKTREIRPRVDPIVEREASTTFVG